MVQVRIQERRQMNRTLSPRRKNRGDAMIVVICMIAVLMVLSASLLMAASSAIGAATNRAEKERCRVLSSTLSQSISKEITNEQIAKEIGKIRASAEYEADSSIPASGSVQAYLRDKIVGYGRYLTDKDISNNDWECFDEEWYDSTDIPEKCIKTYGINGVHNDVLDNGYELTVRMYWQADTTTLKQVIQEAQSKSEDPELEYGNGSISLSVIVSCQRGDQKQEFTTNYTLETPYDSIQIKKQNPEGIEETVDVKYTFWKWAKGDIS